MKSSVIAVIFNEKQELLVIKRRDVPVWVLPGGGIDENELPEEAAIREIFEETGLVVTIRRKVAEYTPTNFLSRLTHLFECKHLSGIPQTGNETKDIAFFPLNKLPQPFFFLHHDWLKDTLRNEKEIIRLPLKQITYSKLLWYLFTHPLWVFRLALSRLGIPFNSK